MNKRGLAWWELLVALVLIGVVAVILLPALAREHGPARRASCQNNLKEMGLVFKMYANESKGEKYPPMMGTVVGLLDCTGDRNDAPAVAGVEDLKVVRKGGFVAPEPSIPLIYPEYLNDPNVFQCPNDTHTRPFQYATMDSGTPEILSPCVQEDRGMRGACPSYFYFGWAFDRAGCGDAYEGLGETRWPKQMAQIMAPLLKPWRDGKAEASNVAALDTDIVGFPEGEGNGPKGTTVYRLREGVERLLTPDWKDQKALAEVQRKVWIMADVMRAPVRQSDGKIMAATNHVPGGCNVLYMDGHVAFEKFEACGGGKDSAGPMNELVAGFLNTAFANGK